MDESYNVQPGLCVIINNMVFKHGLSELPGGKKDEESLAVLFITLGFDVKIHENLTANEIINKTESYGKMEHKGAFFLVILSHGTLVKNRGAVLGTDGKTVSIHELETYFHAAKCHSLRGIPKIFMIDACRGNKTEKVLKSEPIGNMATKKSSASLSSLVSTKPVTDSVDFLIVYASTHGKVAYTDSKGSQMTQAFVEVTSKADTNTTFTKIIQKVKARLQQTDSPQTVESVDRLTRDYYIRRYITALNSLLIELL